MRTVIRKRGTNLMCCVDWDLLIKPARPVLIRELCAACGNRAEGNFSIHRDGFGDGPEVPLCDACGCGPVPTLTEIWDAIAQRRKERVS